MITKTSIKNFKGIRKCGVNGFGTINLFIGKNDVCKSTILEAIYYSLKEFTGANLYDIIGRRTNVLFGARELWYNYNTANVVSMNTVFDEGASATIGINISLKGTPSGDIDINCAGTIDLGTAKNRSAPLSVYSASNWKIRNVFRGLSLLDNLPQDIEVVIKEYITNCQFLDSSYKNDVKSIETLFGKIKSQGRVSEFNKYLLTTFEKGSKVKFLHEPDSSTPDRYKVVVVEPNRRVFVSGLGDGIRYGMQIIGTGLVCRNTALFIEEIESNQHPASLKKLISFLIEIAIKNKLQLFITTHSYDAWRFFVYHFKTIEQRNAHLRCFHVRRDSLTGEVICEQVNLSAADQMKVHESLFGLETR